MPTSDESSTDQGDSGASEYKDVEKLKRVKMLIQEGKSDEAMALLDECIGDESEEVQGQE